MFKIEKCYLNKIICLNIIINNTSSTPDNGASSYLNSSSQSDMYISVCLVYYSQPDSQIKESESALISGQLIFRLFKPVTTWWQLAFIHSDINPSESMPIKMPTMIQWDVLDPNSKVRSHLKEKTLRESQQTWARAAACTCAKLCCSGGLIKTHTQ